MLFNQEKLQDMTIIFRLLERVILPLVDVRLLLASLLLSCFDRQIGVRTKEYQGFAALKELYFILLFRVNST